MIPLNILPLSLVKFAYIAGGYAACPALADDMDVWIEVPPTQLRQVRAQILDHLHEHGFEFHEEDTIWREEEGYALWTNICKVAKVNRGTQVPVHILVTDAPLHQVLKAFDISTHQIALTSGGVVTGPDWTPITVLPVALRDTPHTQRRMNTITQRYAPHGAVKVLLPLAAPFMEISW